MGDSCVNFHWMLQPHLMGIFWLMANGIGLGLGAAAPIGPVNVEIARRTLRCGRPAGWALGCGAVTIDVGYAIVASMASVRIMENGVVRNVIGVVGGLFLGYLAFLSFRSAVRARKALKQTKPTGEAMPTLLTSQTVPATRLSGHYAHGILMTALNPMTLIFWFVGVPGAVSKLTADARQALPWVCAGVFAGALAWVIFFTWLVGHLGRFGRERWLGWVDVAGGAVLLAFAVSAIWRVAGPAL